jgi:predicted short-subunit dehydrogenase-like oxidoreductase (DUF2520 family)
VTAIGIVGPGRAGVGFGLALSRAGHRVFVHGERDKVLPVVLEHTWGGTPPWLTTVEVVMLAVPDDALAGVARDLAATRKVGSGHTVLHLAGLLDRSILAPLEPAGAAIGSLHPLQSISDPLTAPDRFKGAFVGVEGDERAVKVASGLARTMGMRPITVPSAQKPLYHAGAVFASNYLVVVAAIAARLLREAGFGEREAREALAPLLAGTVANVREMGEAALTGPVKRGDAGTVRRHLELLPEDFKEAYRALARAALAIANLPGDKREAVERVLAE